MYGELLRILGVMFLTLAEYKDRHGEAKLPPDADIEASLISAEQTVIDFTDRYLVEPPALETRIYRFEPHSLILNIDDAVDVFTVSIDGRYTLLENFQYRPMKLRPDPVYTAIELEDLPYYDPNYAVTHVVPWDLGYAHRGLHFIEVTAEFGWPEGSLPKTIAQAVAWLVDEMTINSAEDTGIAAESIENLSYVYKGEAASNAPAKLPPRVEQILGKLQRVSF